MKKFIFKLIIFVLPFLVFINLPKIKNYVFNDEICAKINTFVSNFNEPMIIVGGDSRAERQIIPKIMAEKLGISTINIGVSAGDIASFYNSLYKYNLLHKDVIAIISVSSVELNDSFINKWGIPQAYVSYMTLWDRINIFRESYLSVLHERFLLIINEIFTKKSSLVLNHNDSRIKTRGFLGVSGDVSQWDLSKIHNLQDDLEREWYFNSIYNGVSKRTFSKIIKKIADTNMNIVIFQPPVSLSWYKHIEGTYIDSIELNHSKYLKSISSKYDNISFIDFYTTQSTVYHDSMFDNSIHLNYKGAKIFTNTLLDSLIYNNFVE